MSKPIAAIATLAVFLSTAAASAEERTVTLAVQNMDCAICPHTVKASLEAVPGVAKVVVSFKDKTAIVTYDDSRTDVPALTNATTQAGYPSVPKS
jgi:mercuric ion binding protein